MEQPYFNEPGYQSSRNTPAGELQSSLYNQKIQLSTLQYGYLDHFKHSHERTQLSKYILPQLVRNWVNVGKQVASSIWLASNTALKDKISQLISEIDEEVEKYMRNHRL